MKLEVNNAHKKIDTSNLNHKVSTVINCGALVITLFAGAFIIIPGALKNKPANEYKLEDIKNMSDKRLSSLEHLSISLKDFNGDLSYLNYCPELEELLINCDIDDLNCLNSLKNLPNLKRLILNNTGNGVYFNVQDAQYINNMTSLKEIDFYDISIAPGCEEQLDKLETIRMHNWKNVDLDFTKFKNLKTMDFTGCGAYNVAVYLNTEEYNSLINNNIEVKFGSSHEKKDYLNACKKLDNIVESLGATNYSSDKEKLDAILIYVLENLTYDPEIIETTVDNKVDTSLSKDFYKDGLLYGALEKDTVICGNYAAMVEALSDRLGCPTDSYLMLSDCHAWNLINIDDQLYYVDSTWLDATIVKVPSLEVETDPVTGERGFFHDETVKSVEECIKEGYANSLNWYMTDYDSKDLDSIDTNKSHIPNQDIPQYMIDLDSDSKNVHTNNKQLDLDKIGVYANLENVSNKEVNIRIANKDIRCSLGALVGVMTSLGIAIHIKKKKEKEKAEQIENHVR